MYYRLRDGLSWCLCGEQTVFLDLARDRYFRLSAQDDHCFRQWAASGATAGIAASRLIPSGILLPCETPQNPRATADLPPLSGDLGGDARARARLIDIWRSLVAQRRARSLIQSGQLSNRLAAIARHPKPAEMPDPGTDLKVGRIAAAFASALLGFNKRDQCLPRALAALALCRAAGATPTLVFGVRLEPFAAHCWLQWRSEVVVGDLEQARMFTPILAIS